jgi:hypothetical protein
MDYQTMMIDEASERSQALLERLTKIRIDETVRHVKRMASALAVNEISRITAKQWTPLAATRYRVMSGVSLSAIEAADRCPDYDGCTERVARGAFKMVWAPADIEKIH